MLARQAAKETPRESVVMRDWTKAIYYIKFQGGGYPSL